jgi:hypothetical protein
VDLRSRVEFDRIDVTCSRSSSNYQLVLAVAFDALAVPAVSDSAPALESTSCYKVYIISEQQMKVIGFL